MFLRRLKIISAQLDSLFELIDLALKTLLEDELTQKTLDVVNRNANLASQKGKFD